MINFSNIFSSKTEAQKAALKGLKKSKTFNAYLRNFDKLDGYLGTIEEKGTDLEKQMAQVARKACNKAKFRVAGTNDFYKSAFKYIANNTGGTIGVAIAELAMGTGLTVYDGHYWDTMKIEDFNKVENSYLEDIASLSDDPLEKQLAEYGLKGSEKAIYDKEKFWITMHVTRVIAEGKGKSISDNLINAGSSFIKEVIKHHDGAYAGAYFLDKVAENTKDRAERILANTAATIANGGGENFVSFEGSHKLSAIAFDMLKEGIKNRDPKEVLRDFSERADNIKGDYLGEYTPRDRSTISRRINESLNSL